MEETSNGNAGMTYSPHKSSSNTCCCVYACKSYSKKDATLRFHILPKAGENVTIINKFNEEETIDRRKAWQRILKIDKNFSNNARVCSLHFCKEDYVMPAFVDFPSKTKRLKKTAIPSQNLPYARPASTLVAKKKINDEKRNRRAVARSLQSQLNKSTFVKTKDNCEFSNSNTSENNNVNCASSKKDDDNNDSKTHANCGDNEKDVENNDNENCEIMDKVRSLYMDKGVQVSTDIGFQFIKNEKDLFTLTGIASFKLLYVLENSFRITVPTSKCFFSQLSVTDRIIMTFIKLKQNVSYAMLSTMFQVSKKNCRQIVLRVINVLSVGLKFAIRWPSKTEILKNIPLCFNDFSDVRAVIDVIEILIQKPKNLCCQLGSYSTYKETNTVRFMTAISPGGLITYVSKPFLGRSSDKAMFEENGFIKYFEKGDALMIDKGFLIDEICTLHDVKLIRPTFLENKMRFTKEEALLNAKIAKARVHIERSNQHVQVFTILSGKVPSYLLSRIEQVFTVICAVVNLSSPILSDERFNK